METYQEAPKVYSSIEPGIFYGKKHVMRGFVNNSIIFFLAMISYLLLYLIGIQSIVVIVIFSYVLLIGYIFGIVGMFQLNTGIKKLRKYFAGNLDTNLKRIFTYMLIFGILFHVLGIIYTIALVNLTPFSLISNVLHTIALLTDITAFVMLILTMIEVKKACVELAKLAPIHSTKIISYYPTIISASILIVLRIVKLILSYLAISSPAFRYIFYSGILLLYLILGLGLIEMSIKFNKIDGHRISRLVQIS